MLQNHTAKVGIYARRSPEDKQNRQNMFRGDGVSDSIESQLLLLHQFAAREGFTDCREYYDDNISGTTFVRQSFMRMLDDVREGKIDTVIVKDLSRLGRDYIESGRYQEIVFPELGTRLIAVNDGYDSATGAGMDTAVFKNVFNDYYVRDISKKVKSALSARASAGKYLCAGTYGYQKDPADKNHLLPDPETAPVVRRIFALVIEGNTFTSIARTLSSEGILKPSAYRDVTPKTLNSTPTDWHLCTIKHIIRNRVYLGKTVYGKTRKVSYKSKLTVNVPEDEYIIVDGTHEPLVSQETWDLANDIANRHKKPSANGEISIFAGLLRCAECGSAMLKSGRNTHVCRRYKSFGQAENGCTSHRISYKLLYAAVLASIQEVTDIVRKDRGAMIARLSGMENKKQMDTLNAAKNEQGRIEKRLADIGKLVQKAFEGNVLGTLADDVYKGLMDGYANERTELNARLEQVVTQIDSLTKSTDNAHQFVSLAEQYIDVKELDRDLLHRLIDRIEIHESFKEDGIRYQNLDIYYRFVGKLDM